MHLSEKKKRLTSNSAIFRRFPPNSYCSLAPNCRRQLYEAYAEIGDAHQPEFICRRQLYEAYAEIRVPGNLQRFYSAENELERSQLDLAPV